MPYTLLILRRAQKELSLLPDGVYERVKVAISRLANHPKPRVSRKLTGRPGWRLRISDYRVIYEIDDNNHTVTILHIGHRRDVYK